jgi:hypothetical protein
MATQTSNLGLTKPGYDEAADVVPAVNNNMDILDEKMGAVPANTSVQAQITANAQAIAKLDESIAIVSNGNTHAAIAAGQYVYIKGHGTLAEGLYTANSAISANATLSNSNVTAVSGGGLNALNSNITTQFNNKLGDVGIRHETQSLSFTAGTATPVETTVPSGFTRVCGISIADNGLGIHPNFGYGRVSTNQYNVVSDKTFSGNCDIVWFFI